MKKPFLAIILTLILGFQNGNAQDARTILSKVDRNVFSATDKTATVEIQMINLKTNNKKIKKAILYQKGLDKKLFRYTYPKSDKGIASLTLPDAVYLYLPMFKKAKKITNLAESNKFNKTDFSLNDRDDKTYTERFTPKLMKTTVDNYILNLIPKKNGGTYSRLVMDVDKKNYYPKKIEYYNQTGKKLKEATYKFIKIGKLWVVKSITMKNVITNHQTTFAMSDIKINTGLKDEMFTPEFMGKE